jgi:putative hydrolase of the HAD superfamily
MSELIDAAVYSSEIEWTKPHPDAFRAILDALGIDQADRAVFVGDRRFDDIHGAQSVGMRAVLIPHSDIPDEQRGHTEGEPDAIIDRLSDLLPIIDEWRAI